jgi:glycosyl transferase family 25
MLFDCFDRIRVVNLPHRTDRRAEMEREFRRVGLDRDPRVAFFDAISCADRGPFLRRGSHGNFRSQLTLIKEAAEADEAILILEDDCDFRVPEVLEFEMPDQWDIFYGGYLDASDSDNLADSDIIGSHFMGFSSRAAKAAARYLTDYLEPDFVPDPRAAAEPGYDPAIRPPIDGAYVWFRRAHPELRTVFSQLGVQRPSRTDVGEQRWFDRAHGVRELAGLARKTLRQLGLR